MGTEDAQPQRRLGDDGLVRRSFGITVRAVNVEARTVDVIASTTTVDSHGDIVEQDWILDRYKKNPVVLWNHNKFGSYSYADGMCDPKDLLPIGHCPSFGVEGGQLVATIKFGSADYNEMSERVFLGFAEQHIRAVSVGFYPGVIAEEAVEGGSRYRLSKCELLEISVVPIPSNPDAVAKSAAAEHEYIGRLAAERRARAQENEPMAMTAEEKAALDKALADTKAATELAQHAEAKATMLKEELATAQAALKSERELREKADAARTKSELDALQGVKFAPAERERLEKHVKALGLDEVIASLTERPSLAVTQDNLAGDLKTRGVHQPAPKTTETPAEADVDAEFNKALSKRIHGTAAA
jgi:hypothetical protein